MCCAHLYINFPTVSFSNGRNHFQVKRTMGKTVVPFSFMVPCQSSIHGSISPKQYYVQGFVA